MLLVYIFPKKVTKIEQYFQIYYNSRLLTSKHPCEITTAIQH